MKLRPLVLSLLLVTGFVWFTTSRWSPVQLELKSPAKLWSEPQTAQSADLTSEENSNIAIYRSASPATVNITSTVYQRDWFFQVFPVRESGSGFLIDADFGQSACALLMNESPTASVMDHIRFTATTRQVKFRTSAGVTLVQASADPAETDGREKDLYPSLDELLIDLRDGHEYILIDAPAGIDPPVRWALDVRGAREQDVLPMPLGREVTRQPL